MKTSQILLLGGLAVGAYLLLAPKTPPGVPYGATYLPPNGVYNGFYNNSGGPVWLNALGIAFNGAGQILNSIPWGSILPGQNNSNNNYTGGILD